MNNKQIRLEEITSKYETILREELCFPIADFISYTIGTRAKRRYGRCRLISENCYDIEISDFLLEDNVSDESIANTVIHELLHTIKGCMNHKEKWKRYASIVNNKLGCNVKRTTTREEKGIEPYKSKEQVKYIFRCKECGQVIKMKRKSDFVKRYELYNCGICKGKFERIK